MGVYCKYDNESRDTAHCHQQRNNDAGYRRPFGTEQLNSWVATDSAAPLIFISSPYAAARPKIRK